MSAGSLSGLAPAERAELIYRAARVGLEDQLWQAALGALPSGAEPSPARPAAMLSIDTLVEALSSEDRLAPRLTDKPAVDLAEPSGALRLGPNERYRGLLENAAARAGLDPAILATIVDAEAARRPDGSWNPASRNSRSSAAGLGQFLSGTWVDEAQRSGTWLHQFASARGWLTGDGRISERDRAELLALREDPAASIQAVADHAAANLQRLSRGGVTPTDNAGQARAAYLAHHLGVGDALRFLSKGLPEGRAGHLLAAQVGSASAANRIAAAGSAAEAHRDWLLAYVDRRIRPQRFYAA